MTTDYVNLDGLLPREDFPVGATVTGGGKDPLITLTHLAGDNNFWAQSLRKPDFQRETSRWEPQKIVDLIAAYLDADLIPAIILWRAGHLVYVIDGAHRISAMLAWIHDDYGQGPRSLAQYEGGQIPKEQLKLAETTRQLVDDQIGPYARFQAIWKNMHIAPPPLELAARVGNFQHNGFFTQWVPTVDPDAAQTAFFAINQKQTVLDPTEQVILLNRRSASAIATRAIVRSGSGHRYWGGFADEAIQGEIEAGGAKIYKAMYTPPLADGPVKSGDVPLCGRGYSALPFVFDVVNQANGILTPKAPTKSKPPSKKAAKKPTGSPSQLPTDQDGSLTVEYLSRVQKKLRLITTDHALSLGLHPLVYFYTMGGKFQPNAFLALLPVFERIETTGKLSEFTEVRSRLEDFLLKHKDAFTGIVKSQGGKEKSRPAIGRFVEAVIEGLQTGKTEDDLVSELGSQKAFHHITAKPLFHDADGKSDRFQRGTRSAAYIEELSKGGVRCAVCGALVHRNSMHTDHKTAKRDGGDNRLENAQITHPFLRLHLQRLEVAERPHTRAWKDRRGLEWLRLSNAFVARSALSHKALRSDGISSRRFANRSLMPVVHTRQWS